MNTTLVIEEIINDLAGRLKKDNTADFLYVHCINHVIGSLESLRMVGLITSEQEKHYLEYADDIFNGILDNKFRDNK